MIQSNLKLQTKIESFLAKKMSQHPELEKPNAMLEPDSTSKH